MKRQISLMKSKHGNLESWRARSFRAKCITANLGVGGTWGYTSVLAVAIFITACGSGDSGRSSTVETPQDTSYLSPPGETRRWLTVSELQKSSQAVNSPYNVRYFMPVGTSAPPNQEFHGSLVLKSTSLSTDGPTEFQGESLVKFPDVDLSFISKDGFLIPTNQKRQFSELDNSYWGIIVSPGRVWSEPGDGNWSRASFPFVLIHRYRNEAHNGIATFLFDSVSTSNLRVEVIQETAAWARNNFWGQLRVSYLRRQFADEDQILSAFAQRRAIQIPISNWEDLEALHGSPLVGFDQNVTRTDISASGLLWNGVLYVSACPTRYGEFPYCRYMRHGAFSVTKSAAAAAAMFRLAKKFGPEVLHEKINEYVTVTATHDGWESVTFRDVLNMTTGIGDESPDPNSNDIFADENQPKMENFQLIPSKLGKLQAAFSYGNYPWGPGEKLRYNSTQTFVLANAMDEYLKVREGPGSSIWKMLMDEVFEPIGVAVMPMTKTIEPDNAEGLPLFYVGLYPTIEDIARIAQLLQDEGLHGGTQILDADTTATALYRRGDQGTIAGWWTNNVGTNRYLLSFWSWPIEEASGCKVQIPVMSGFGGNIIAILPNGVSAIRFADAYSYEPGPLIDVARQFGPSC